MRHIAETAPPPPPELLGGHLDLANANAIGLRQIKQMHDVMRVRPSTGVSYVFWRVRFGFSLGFSPRAG